MNAEKMTHTRLSPMSTVVTESRTALRFPETPIRKIEVPGFTNVWMKDESVNEYSGTHKDRLAWDAVNLYRGIVRARGGNNKGEPLPQFSIITSGSAGIAIGRAFRQNGFPKLKVLVDFRIDKKIFAALQNAHCEVFTADLAERPLCHADILRLTQNEKGLELTSHKDIAIDIGSYDSLSFDVLNQSPEYVFVPFGTGVTYKKLIYTAENLLTHERHERDPRYRGDVSKIGTCHFIGATTHNPHSIADKLHSPHSPFQELKEDQLEFYKNAGYCGAHSGIYDVEEKFLNEAMRIAESQGIVCEASGIAGLALLLQM